MPRASSATPKPTRLRVASVIALILGLGGVLAAIVAIGKLTRESVRDWDRYTLPLTEIDFPAPPAQTREEFLAEVQQLGELPDCVSMLDDVLPPRLAAAFALHPWVAKVERVSVRPPRQLQVQLVYRLPVLEVMPTDRARGRFEPRKESGGQLEAWLVDNQGVPFPRKKFSERLPLMLADVLPAHPMGKPGADVDVQAAALIASYLRTHQARLKLISFEATTKGLVLSTSAGTHVIWGSAEGSGATGEVSAAQKLERLLQYCSNHGDLDKPAGPYEHDVRPPAAMTSRRLPGADLR